MKTYNIRKIKYAISALYLCVVIVLAAIGEQATAPLLGHAATNYSNVLDDLQSDESFNASDYPAASDDYSLEVIQIAESEDDELFIYVYQPYTGGDYDLTATSINISTTVGENNLYYKNYSLTLLNSSGTLYKYIVNNFTVQSATVRYYDISSIYRTYYAAIDGEETGDNTTGELAIAVAQQWAAGEVNGATYYDMQESKVVTISSYAGFVRYSGDMYSTAWGLSTTKEYIDAHFIAFSCDYDIEDLYEADISFYTQSKKVSTYTYNDYEGESNNAVVSYGEIDSTYYDTPLTIEQGEVSYEVTYGLFGLSKSVYTWDRICTVDEFKENLAENENITYDNDFFDNISNMQWVVRFYESDFSTKTTGSAFSAYVYQFNSTIVTDITVLRLYFLSEGETYNLGVVSNKITGSEDPDATVEKTSGCPDFIDLIKQLLIILALVILFIMIAPLLPYIARLIVWIISLPFKLISAIAEAIKKASNNKKNE